MSNLSFKNWLNLFEVTDFASLPMHKIDLEPNDNSEIDDLEPYEEKPFPLYHYSNCEDAADHLLGDERQKAIKDCIEQRKKEHEQDENHKKQERNQQLLRRDQFSDYRHGYKSYFKVNGKFFRVIIQREIDRNFNGKTIPNVLDVTFSGPNHYSVTNSSSPSEAKEVYNHIIAAIIKASEIDKQKTGKLPDAFYFSAYNDSMKLIYNKLYKTYLNPAGYILADENLYLNKDFIRDNYQDKTSKKDLYGNILTTNREKRNSLEDLKFIKARNRQQTQIIQNYIEKPIVFADYKGKNQVGFVYKLDFLRWNTLCNSFLHRFCWKIRKKGCLCQ